MPSRMRPLRQEARDRSRLTLTALLARRFLLILLLLAHRFAWLMLAGVARCCIARLCMRHGSPPWFG